MSAQPSSSPALASSAGPFERLVSLRLRLDWELALYVLFIVAGATLRFWDLGARAFHHDESLHAQFSWYLFDQGNYDHSPMMHGPFQFFGTAFTYVLFGVSDYTARILPAFFGTALIGLPFFLRRHLGRSGALAAAGLIAFSPTLLYFSRFARNDIYIGLWTLGLVVCLWRYIEEGRHRYLYIAAGLLALSFATKEATFLNVAILIAFLDLWIAQTLASQIRERHDLDPLAGPFLFLALAPFAWAIVAVWPFLSEEARQRIGLGERPRAADFLLILGTLSLPQFAATIKVPLEGLGIVGEADWSRKVLTLNLEPLREQEQISREGLTGFLTVSILVASTAIIGLRWNWRSWLIVGAIFYAAFGLLYTAFLTNLDGFASGMWESVDYWLEQQDVRRGGQPFYYYLLLLPAYEFLPLLFAFAAAGVSLAKAAFGPYTPEGHFARIVFFIAGSLAILALIASAGGMSAVGMLLGLVALALLVFSLRVDPFLRFLTFWMMMSLFAYSVAGEKMPWLNVHLTLPVVILAAYVLGQLWQLARTAEWRLRLPSYMSDSLNGGLQFSIPSYTWPLLAAALGAGAVAFAAFGPTDAAGNAARIFLAAAALLAIAALTITLLGRAMSMTPLEVVAAALLALLGVAALAFRIIGPTGMFLEFIAVVAVAALAINLWERATAVVLTALVGALLLLAGGDAMASTAFGPTNGVGNTAHIVLEVLGVAALLTIAVLAVTPRERVIAVLPLAALVGALLLFSGRVAWMASFEEGAGADAREMLVYTQTSSDVPTIRDQIEQMAKETGLGKDLPIVVDGLDLPWPWQWYLRNYHDVSYPNMKEGHQPPANAVVLVNIANDAAMQPYLDGYGPGQRHSFRWWFPEWQTYRGLEELEGGKRKDVLAVFTDFVVTLGDSDTWDTWWRYLRDREPPVPKGSLDAVAYFPEEFTPEELIGREEPLAAPKADSEGRFTLGEQGTGPGRFIKPAGLAVDGDGNLYVADSGNHRVQKFDPDGRFMAEVGSQGEGEGEFNEPWGVAVDSEGNLYVADTWNNRIQKFDRDLNFLTQWGQPASDLSNPKPYGFWGPRDVATDAEGNVWVADTGNSRVLKFASDGTFLASLGEPGAEAGQLREPVGIEIAPNGDILVADAWNSRIQRFDSEFNLVAQFPMPNWVPEDPSTKPYLALTPDGSIIASETASHRLLRIGTDGRILSTLEGLGETALVSPTGLALDDRGFLYISNSGVSQIRRVLLTDMPGP